MTDLGRRLIAAFGPDRVRRDASLAPFTTFKVGGPADWLVEVNSGTAVEQAAAIARESTVPLTILGGGSNVLVADSGIRGVVLRVHGGEVHVRLKDEALAFEITPAAPKKGKKGGKAKPAEPAK